MLPYHSLIPHSANETNYVPHIHALNNLSFPLSQLQRGILHGNFSNTNDYLLQAYTYEPPSLQWYTIFSLKTYFFVFWGILFLQCLTIFLIDKIWVRNVPQKATLWERILHSIQKSSFPFPYTNWHQENGNCYDHYRRKRAVQHEVMLSILINLFFNMILLTPLPIFCKLLISFSPLDA